MAENYLRNLNLFLEKEIEDFLGLFEKRRLKKNDCFVREGEKCKEVAFIESGIFRSYYVSHEGKDNTYCFRFPNDFMASYSSFISGNPSVETMQAISEADLLVLQKDRIEELFGDNHHWIKFLKLIAEQEYIQLEKRFIQLQRDSASQRYLSLLQNQPNYIQDIPLQYLASYLGITQRHLSRIRKEISF